MAKREKVFSIREQKIDHVDFKVNQKLVRSWLGHFCFVILS